MQSSSLNYALPILWVSYNGYRPLVVNFFSKKSSMTSTVHKKNKMCDSCFVWDFWVEMYSAAEQQILQESSELICRPGCL